MELTQDLIDKTSKVIEAFAVKLGVASEYVFQAGVRYIIAEEVAALLICIILTFTYYKLYHYLYPKINFDTSYWPPEACAFVWFSSIIGLILVIVWSINIAQAVPIFIAPDFALIKEMASLLR